MTNEYIVERDGFAFVVPKNHNFKFELLEGQQMLDIFVKDHYFGLIIKYEGLLQNV